MKGDEDDKGTKEDGEDEDREDEEKDKKDEEDKKKDEDEEMVDEMKNDGEYGNRDRPDHFLRYIPRFLSFVYIQPCKDPRHMTFPIFDFPILIF